jgi:hypothetical protein
MKTTRKRILVFVLVAAALLLTASGAFANTRTGGGGDMPFYARIEREFIVQDNEWAAIIFYRPPECVPDGEPPYESAFNLLDTLDFNAFACTPPTTDGFAIWAGEPWVSPPIQIKLHENGLVPVWFVDWGELQAAIADDVLTMPELEGLPSLLVGAAENYSEVLHPTDAHNVPLIDYVAQGSLEDGRSFFVHAQSVFSLLNVQIEFK